MTGRRGGAGKQDDGAPRPVRPVTDQPAAGVLEGGVPTTGVLGGGVPTGGALEGGQPGGSNLGAWDAIAGRRAVRRFGDRPLDPAHLARILAAGRRSGSAKNLQRWDFIVCRDRDHLRELSALGPWAGHVAGAAVAIALVTPDPHAPGVPLSLMFDLGQAAAYMQLAAWELGVGSCPATVYEQDLARRLLGYPADRHCEFLLSFGYPADPAKLTAPLAAGGRRPLAEIVHEERW